MKENYIGQVGIWGCGSPVETSAGGRSTDRGGSRDQRHYQYLKDNKPTVINVMRMKGTLKSYLRGIDDQAEEMLFKLVKQMAKDEGVTEELKRREQMKWGAGLRWRPLPEAEAPTEAAAETGLMNNIRNRAEEIVLREVIYV